MNRCVVSLTLQACRESLQNEMLRVLEVDDRGDVLEGFGLSAVTVQMREDVTDELKKSSICI